MQMISMEIFHMLNSLISILCNEKLNKIYTNFFFISCANEPLMDPCYFIDTF